MRRWLARIATWVGTGIAALWLGARAVLDIIGYSTSPEDAEGVPAKAAAVLSWIATQPWLIAYGVPALLIGFGALTLWPHSATSPPSSALIQQPVAVRDKRLVEGLSWIAFQQWGASLFPAGQMNPAMQALSAFHQAAADDAITTWGRRSPNHGPYEKIPATFWNYNHVDLEQVFERVPSTHRHAIGVVPYDVSDPFFDIMVSSAELERQWPNL